jgi:hypothetical protein
MASALRIKKFKSRKPSPSEQSLATAVGRIVMKSMSAGGISRVLGSKRMSGLLGKVHTPAGRRKAMEALAKIKTPLYSAGRNQRTGEFQIERGRIKAGEFVRSRQK